jgi:REP element-mobilizing transposase RayT
MGFHERSQTMARQARGEVLNPREIQVVHAVQRCVRQAYLCGNDALTGKSFEHRREWIRQRLEFLASVFGIDCLTFAIMSNHLHLVLRSRPDVVATWSDSEVARRWLRLFPRRRDKDGLPCEPSAEEVNSIVRHKPVLAQRRERLSDISWWMRCTAEVIARRANREDECRGRFWEGRFKAQVLLDEASLLACAAYVDLNPIRAAMAKTLETSLFTGAKERIDDLTERSDQARGGTHTWERSDRRQRSGWLSPIEIKEGSDPLGADACVTGRRASQKGFLSMSMTTYLELLDWTGRQLRSDKRGRIPEPLSPILERIGLGSDAWCDLVQTYGQRFKRAAGTVEHLEAEAARRGQQWMQSPGNPLGAAA